METGSLTTNAGEPQKRSWNAVWALTIGVAGLIIAEFLPAGVLTPMANDLHITEGMAGQTVTTTSVFAVVTSLSIAYLTRSVNRRTVLLSLSTLLTASSLIVAFAPNFPVLLFGRVLLGISLGGFWSMATAIAIRLVPEDQVPKALSIIFGGSSFASVLAAPMGSSLGGMIGWRGTFLIAAAIGLAAFIWQFASLPSLPPIGNVKLRTTIDVLKTPQFAAGLLGIVFVFGGCFASFTYLRPFLEQTTKASANWVSTILLVFGLAYFVGNAFAPGMIKRNIQSALAWPPMALFIVSIGVVVFGQNLRETIGLVFLWGALFGPVAPGWSTWVAKKVPEHAETGGGLYVAAVQFAAALGALGGGVIFDSYGSSGVFTLSGISWHLSGLIVTWNIKTTRRQALQV